MLVGDIKTETRARNVCLAGLILQVVLTTALGLLYLFDHSSTAFAAARYMFGGLLLWLPILILYQQRRQVAIEGLETEELRRQRADAGTESIFELEQEEFLVAQRRLKWMVRWLLPSFVLLAVVYFLAGHFFVWPSEMFVSVMSDEHRRPIENASLSMLFVAGVAFLSFLFSRYLSGMSRQAEYRLLKSVAIYLFGNAVICLFLAIGLGLVSTDMPIPERILAMVVRYLLVLLGLEYLVNFILDFYRPRLTDEVLRPAFESRLIGLISEPGGIAKSIAEAVNYQFGFEVSATWFYKLLEQAVVPLAALSIIVLIGMTSISVVDADELALIERFGRPVSEQPIGPGIYLKMPWPVDVLRKAKVSLVQEIVIGEAAQSKDNARKEGEDEVITWTEEHKYIPSVDVLVATRDDRKMGPAPEPAGPDDSTAVAVSILRMSMPVQFRVRHDATGFRNYLYNYTAPQAMLRDIAYRELIKQAVHFDYQKIMAEQRRDVTDKLQRLIQERCDEMRLGLEIVFVGLQDVHPPTEQDVAATFQKVASAEQHRDTLIRSAQVEYTRKLVSAAGDVGRAERIHELISGKGNLVESETESRSTFDRQLAQQVLGDPLAGIMPIQGEAGQMIQEARAEAQQQINAAAAKARTFELILRAYQASPEVFRMRAVLDGLEEQLDKIRKFLILVDPQKTKLIIQLDEHESSGLQIIEAPRS